MPGRILHLFNAFQVGGVERQHLLLVERLAGEFDQFCWAYNHGQAETELDRLHVPHIAGPFPEEVRTLAAMDFDCAVLRTHTYFYEILEFLKTRALPVIYIKDYLRWFQGNDTYLDPSWDCKACSAANHVFFCGPALREGVLGASIRPRSWGMLLNSLDLSRFPMASRPAGKNGTLRAGMLGNIIPRKNQLAAIRALKGMLAEEKAQLFLGGDFHSAEYAAELRRGAQGLPVEFKGYVANVPEFMAGIDVLLMTSLLEGWPVALMEAMACGVPVCAPAIGDIPELLEHGKAGLLFPPDDWESLPGLIESLREPEVYGRFSRAGVERVRHLDADAAAESVAGVLRGILAPADRRMRL